MIANTFPARPRLAGLPRLSGNRWLMPVLSVVALLAAWQLVSIGVSAVILPAPASVATSLVTLTASGALPSALLQTIIPFLEGLALSIAVGIALGWATGLFLNFGRFVDPYIFIFWSTPTIALLPLIFVWFGIGNAAQVAFVFLSAVFPMIINTQAGVRQVERTLVEVVESLGANRREVLRMVVIPFTYPYIFSGLRIALGRAVVGIIVAEILIAATGIGYMLQYYGEALQLANYFAPLIVTALLAIAMNQAINRLERRLIRWRSAAF
ncbi:MAG: ABC transporter permease [Chloroflexota bacterium]